MSQESAGFFARKTWAVTEANRRAPRRSLLLPRESTSVDGTTGQQDHCEDLENR
jgi:hypothetical protein